MQRFTRWNTKEMVAEIAGCRQLDDYVFTRVGLCRDTMSPEFWRRDGDRRLLWRFGS